MHLKFSGRGLAFLSHYMAQNDIRYYLNGIYLAPMPSGQGVIGAATNGHVMGIWRDPDGRIERPVIARISKGLASACRKPDTSIENIDGRLTCVQHKPGEGGGAFELYVQPNDKPIAFARTPGVEPWEVEGKFPAVSRVVPKLSDAALGVEATVNATYLGLIAASLPGTKRYGNGVFMRQVHKDGSVLVLCPNVQEAVIVVMPMRGDPLDNHWLPAWLQHAARAEETAALPTPGRQPSDAQPPRDFRPARVKTTA